MNYFLVLSEINKFFQSVSSLDTKLMASAYACENQCYDSILRILSEEIIPDYYENNYRNDTGFGRDEIEYEAEQRKYHYDVIEKTNGEDGNEDCEINITIAGETFVVQTDKWKKIFLDVVLGNSYHITAPKIYIDDMFNMFEELVQVKYALRGLMSIYMSIIGSTVDPVQLKKVLIFQLFLVPFLTIYDLYSGLLALVYLIQNDVRFSEDELQIIDQDAHSENMGLIWSPEANGKQYDELVSDCKRNLKVEQVASKSTAYAIVQIAAEGFPGANDIEYTCFSNGTLLLAPYRKTGAILGFVKYSELTRLNDIIRAIASFNDDNADSLPEGFILFK
ncbi:MAG: hypothetical protein SPK38_01990 [Candidatus Cryptobacteroides sp.]|nr:hypothetical protein [Candidatus Cryptobacteroides sp.]